MCGLDKKKLADKKSGTKNTGRNRFWKNKIEASGCTTEERAGQIKKLADKTLGT